MGRKTDIARIHKDLLVILDRIGEELKKQGLPNSRSVQSKVLSKRLIDMEGKSGKNSKDENNKTRYFSI